MPDEEQITITKGPNEGAFQTVTVTQSQLVFWRNEDTEAHWPSFPGQPQIGPRFQVGPGDNSDNFQPVSSGGAIRSDSLFFGATKIPKRIGPHFRASPRLVRDSRSGQATIRITSSLFRAGER